MNSIPRTVHRPPPEYPAVLLSDFERENYGELEEVAERLNEPERHEEAGFPDADYEGRSA